MDLLPIKCKTLLEQVIGDETLLYDQTGHKAFCLSAAAAAVWHRCDGASTLAELADAATHATGLTVSAELALLTLTTLEQEGLLEGDTQRVEMPPDLCDGPSRRRVIAGLGKAAVLFLPGVAALMTPRAAEAYKCLVYVNGKCVVHTNTASGRRGSSDSFE